MTRSRGSALRGRAHKQRHVTVRAESEARIDRLAHLGRLEQPRRVSEIPRGAERLGGEVGGKTLAPVLRKRGDAVDAGETVVQIDHRRRDHETVVLDGCDPGVVAAMVELGLDLPFPAGLDLDHGFDLVRQLREGDAL